MFRKEKDFVERSRSLLKTKEIKALKRAIIQQLPALSEDTLLEILPSKGDITAIKLADRTMLYAYDGGVLFFDLQGRNQLFPTVLALAKAPTMLRSFVTHGPVSRFVLRGADFMVPGVGNREELRGLKKGEKCSIKIHGNPIPFAVGESGLDFDDLQMVTHGKALVVLHSFGDLLVPSALPAIHLPGFTKEEIMPTVEIKEEPDESDEEGKDRNESGDEGAEEDSDADKETVVNEKEENGAENHNETVEKDSEKADQGEHSETTLIEDEQEIEDAGVDGRQEADGRLQRAIALCIRYSIKDKQLPILLSSFWSMVLRCLTVENQRTELTKSSFRRPAELFFHCQTINLLQCQEENGVISIISINRTHELLRVHKHRDPEKLKVLLTKADLSTSNTNNSDNKSNKKSSLQVVDVYKLPKKIRDIFGSEVGGDLGVSFLRGRGVRQVLQTYASERGLERPNGMLLIPVHDPLLEVVAEMGEEVFEADAQDSQAQRTSQATSRQHAVVEEQEQDDEYIEEIEKPCAISKDMYSMMDTFYLNPSAQQQGLKMKSAAATDGDFPPLPPSASTAAGQRAAVKFHKAVELPPAKAATAVKAKSSSSSLKQATASGVDSSNTKKRVTIADGTVAAAPSSSSSSAPKAISISIEKCCLAIQSKLTRYYAILPNGNVNEAIIKSGPIPKVKLLSEKRAGNKMVTIVRGLDPFGVDLTQLAKACQKKFACSAAVAAVPGIAQQNEVVIQGNVAMELEGFLIETYGLPRGVIDITMPGKKK